MTVKVTRRDMTADDLRWQAAQTKGADAARRMLAIAFVLEDCSRAEAAQACGMDRQTLRDWVHRFNELGLVGPVNKPHGGGAKPRLTAAQKAEISGWVEQGPDIQTDGIVRWRLADLARRIEESFAVTLYERSVGRLLHSLNFSRISVRPRHPKADPAAQETHKKTLPSWSPVSFPIPHATNRSSCGGRMRPASASKAA